MGNPGKLPAIENSIYNSEIYKALDVLVLRENMRQVGGGNTAFQNVLRNIRRGTCTDSDITFLESRVIASEFDALKVNTRTVTLIVPLRKRSAQLFDSLDHRSATLSISSQGRGSQ